MSRYFTIGKCVVCNVWSVSEALIQKIIAILEFDKFKDSIPGYFFHLLTMDRLHTDSQDLFSFKIPPCVICFNMYWEL
jgi:hypothetical protein